MADIDLRRLERECVAAGTSEARAALVRARVRAGLLAADRVRVAALLGDVAAQRALGLPSRRLSLSGLVRELGEVPQRAGLSFLAALLDALAQVYPAEATRSRLVRAAGAAWAVAAGQAAGLDPDALRREREGAADARVESERLACAYSDVLGLVLADGGDARPGWDYLVRHAVAVASSYVGEQRPALALEPALEVGLCGVGGRGPARAEAIRARWRRLAARSNQADELAREVLSWGLRPALAVGAALVRAAGQELEPGPSDARGRALDVAREFLGGHRRGPGRRARLRERAEHVAREPDASGAAVELRPAGRAGCCLVSIDRSRAVSRACARLAAAQRPEERGRALTALLAAAVGDAHVRADAVRALSCLGVAAALLDLDDHPAAVAPVLHLGAGRPIPRDDSPRPSSDFP